MKINNIKINGYGKLKNKDIKFQDGLNIIYGNNEDGKSTLLNYIISSFYGISRTKQRANSKQSIKSISDEEKYMPWDTKEFSGTLDFNLDENCYTIFRDFDKRQVKFFDENGNDHILEYGKDKSKNSLFFEEITGVSRELFENSYIIEQGKSVLDAPSSKMLIQKLSNLIATGEENFSYLELDKKLKVMLRDEIGNSKTSNKPINILEDEINKLTLQVEQSGNIEDKKYEIEKNLNEVKSKHEFYYELLSILKDCELTNDSIKDKLRKIDINEEMINNTNNEISALIENLETFEEELDDTKVKSSQEKSKTRKKKLISFCICLVLSIIVNVCSFIFLKAPLFYYSFAIYIICLLPFFVFKTSNVSEQLSDKTQKLEMKINEINAKVEVLKKQNSNLKSEVANIENQIDNINLQKENLIRDKIEQIVETKVDMSKQEKEEFVDALLKSDVSDIANYVNELDVQIHKIELDKQNNEPEQERYLSLCENLQIKKDEYEILLNRAENLIFAMQVLEQSYSQMKGQISPVFSKDLSNLACKITNGKYNEIKYIDEEGFLARKDNGDYVSASYLSSGTIDQLYIAFRLAMMDNFSKYKLPVILDEAFAHYDDYRLLNILEYLASCNRQVIIFTCTNREKEALDKLDVKYNFCKL